MLKTTLKLDALEAREVPAAIGWVKGGPQPEPPGVVAKVVVVKYTNPCFAVTPVAVAEKVGGLLPSLRLSVASPAVGKAGILLPSLNPVPGETPTQNLPLNGILFPVFVDR